MDTNRGVFNAWYVQIDMSPNNNYTDNVERHGISETMNRRSTEKIITII